jgi:hypothetical protein
MRRLSARLPSWIAMFEASKLFEHYVLKMMTPSPVGTGRLVSKFTLFEHGKNLIKARNFDSFILALTYNLVTSCSREFKFRPGKSNFASYWFSSLPE